MCLSAYWQSNLANECSQISAEGYCKTWYLHPNHIDWFGHLKVQEKFSSSDISWNRAMDEVRTDRLMAKYGKDSLLVIIRDWPISEKYKDKPEMVASLEYLVCLVHIIFFCIIFLNISVFCTK